MEQKLTFQLQRISTQTTFFSELLLDSNRIKFQELMEKEGVRIVRAIIDILTQEEELARYPADWWQALKERWFPKWLLRKFPVKETEIWAIHKYPELAPPEGVIGKEFVHLRLIQPS